MRRWLRRWLGPRKEPERLLLPKWTGMTLEQWREDESLIAWAATLYATPEFQRLMEVLWSQQPAAVLGIETNYAAQVGRAQGYREALLVLAQLPVAPPPLPKKEPEINYKGDPLAIDDDVFDDEDIPR